MRLLVNVPEDMARALNSESRRRILELLRERGPMTLSDLARELGMSKSTVHHHLKELERAGLVRVVREERGVPRPRRYYGLAGRPVTVSGPRLKDAVKYVARALERGRDPRTSILLAISAAYRSVIESLGIDAQEVLYEIGREIGRRLARKGGDKGRLEEYLSPIADDVRVRRDGDRVIVEIKGCRECSDLPYGPACPLEAGIIAGFLSELRGRRYRAREVECCGEGADRCVFVAEPASDGERPRP